MGKKLYVGNLKYSMGNAELHDLFAAYGSVRSAQVCTDRDSGQSKGFGFVEMSSENEAQEAIRSLHGTSHEGRTLTVNEARPREDRGGEERGGAPRGRERGRERSRY